MSRVISKRQSAAEHIDVAIEMFLSGRSLICAITLAGAAEDSMPEPADWDATLLGLMKRDGPTRSNRKEEEIVGPIFNKERNWFKHRRDTEPIIEVAENAAIVMILRACTRYTAVYSSETVAMRRFECWFRKTHPEWLNNVQKN